MSEKWNLGDLAKQLQVPPMRLLEASAGDVRKYRTVRVRKRSGGIRILRIPSPSMMAFQRRMQQRIFRHISVSPAVHGSVEKRSNVTHALVHKDAKAVYLLDLADAFSQATPDKVLAAMSVFQLEQRAKLLLVDLVTFDGSIPQGAPTSNSVWNMVCRELDEKLEAFAKDYGLTYSRYTDELVFSHPTFISHVVRQRIREAVEEAGFVINRAKTRYFQARHGALTVTGLNISDGRAKIPKKTLERIRAIIHRAATDRSIPYATVMSLVGYVRFVSRGYLPKGYLPKRIGAELVRFKFFRNRRTGL